MEKQLNKCTTLKKEWWSIDYQFVTFFLADYRKCISHRLTAVRDFHRKHFLAGICVHLRPDLGRGLRKTVRSN